MTETRKTNKSRRGWWIGKTPYQTKNRDTSAEVSWAKAVVEGHFSFICILLNFSMTMVSCIYV